MDFGIVDLFVIFLITLGPLKSAIVYVTLTADADAGFRRRIAIRTVLTATVVALLFSDWRRIPAGCVSRIDSRFEAG